VGESRNIRYGSWGSSHPDDFPWSHWIAIGIIGGGLWILHVPIWQPFWWIGREVGPLALLAASLACVILIFWVMRRLTRIRWYRRACRNQSIGGWIRQLVEMLVCYYFAIAIGGAMYEFVRLLVV